MPKYLALCKYSPEAYKGLFKESPSAREKFIRGVYESRGARLISMDWLNSGDFTVAITVEGSPEVVAGISVTVWAGGALTDVRTFELISSAEMDKALAHPVSYRPPGT